MPIVSEAPNVTEKYNSKGLRLNLLINLKMTKHVIVFVNDAISLISPVFIPARYSPESESKMQNDLHVSCGRSLKKSSNWLNWYDFSKSLSFVLF